MRSGADTSGFLKAVQVQEKTYKFGDRIAANDDRGRQLSAGLGAWARDASATRKNQAQGLRDQNSAEDGRGRTEADFSGAEMLGNTAATSAAGAKVAAVVMQRHISGASRAFTGYCEKLAETNYYKAGVTDYDRILRPKGSALQTMHRFQAAGIGMQFRPGMAMAPGGLLYSDTMGKGSGHVQTIGTDGARYDQYGRNKFKESNFQWYVPPPGARDRPASLPRPTAAATAPANAPAATPKPAPVKVAFDPKAVGALTGALAVGLLAPTNAPSSARTRSRAWAQDQNRLTGGQSASTPSALAGWGGFAG